MGRIDDMMAMGKGEPDGDEEPESGEYDLSAEEELAGHQLAQALKKDDGRAAAKAICAIIDLHTSKSLSEASDESMREGEEET